MNAFKVTDLQLRCRAGTRKTMPENGSRKSTSVKVSVGGLEELRKRKGIKFNPARLPGTTSWQEFRNWPIDIMFLLWPSTPNFIIGLLISEGYLPPPMLKAVDETIDGPELRLRTCCQTGPSLQTIKGKETARMIQSRWVEIRDCQLSYGCPWRLYGESYSEQTFCFVRLLHKTFPTVLALADVTKVAYISINVFQFFEDEFYTIKEENQHICCFSIRLLHNRSPCAKDVGPRMNIWQLAVEQFMGHTIQGPNSKRLAV